MFQLAAWLVHVPAPAGERWKTTVATPEPVSAESLASTIVPPTAAPFAGAVIEPVGAVASTSHVKVTSVASVFPAASVARASSVCEPSARAGVVNGVEQDDQPPPSRSHSKVAGVSVESRPKVGVAFALGFDGVEPNDVFGAVRSTVQACVAGVASTLPAASSARTSNVCAASVSPVYDWGLEQFAKAPPSSRHSKPGPASDAVNEKLAPVEFDAAGGEEVIVVFAGVRSTVKVNDAGVASTFPAASIARTSNVYVPSASGASVSGLVSAAHAPASTRAWKVVPGSAELNANVGVVSWVAAAGAESIAVSGATVSIRTACASTPVSLPIRSKARYLTVVTPSAATLNAPA